MSNNHEETNSPVTRGRTFSSASTQADVRSFVSIPSPKPATIEFSERKASISYGHHRQASIVHGVQHGGSPKQPSQSSTPLSPRRQYTPISIRRAESPSPIGTNISTSTPNPVSSRNPLGISVGESRTSEHTTQNDVGYPTMKKYIEMMENERSRSNSVSQTRQPELTTVGEYALHHLLTNFIKEADERIERCMNEPNDAIINVESICGPGVDSGFDQLINALGHIGRDRPKSLIDSVMLWRRGKGDVTQALYREADRLRSQSLSDTTGSRRGPNMARFQPETHMDYHSIKLIEVNHKIKHAERRSAVSVYILCRVLIQIISQSRPGTLPDETADRLEEVIWTQVRSTDAQSLSQSMVKQAQWNIFGQLLGVMSGPRFQNVRDRYVAELGALQTKLSVKDHMEMELERKAVLLVGNMSWLKIRITPDAAWEQSCDLLRLLASYFAHIHGRTIKHAYCQLIEDLLLPIAATATAQLNSSTWRSVVEILRVKANQLLLKPKHWRQAFPLLTATLCVSPPDVFISQWQTIILNLQPKLKDRTTRSQSLKSMCRLVWRFLYRIYDRDANKKLDDIIKMTFQAGKRSILTTEPSIADPLIQLIRIIGFRCQDICFRSIIFPLMNADVILSGKDHRIDALEPERMVIGIRAYLAVIADLEKGQQPRFPLAFDCEALLDPYNRLPHSHRRSLSYSSPNLHSTISKDSQPVDTSNLSEATRGYHITFCKILSEICIICDNTFGGQAVLDEKLSHPLPKTPMSDAFAFGRRDEMTNPADMRQSFYDLLHVAVQALPRCILAETPFNPLVNLLCTGTAHMQSHIASSSAQALKSIARGSQYSQQVANGFSRFIFNFDDRYNTVADGGLLGAQHIESTLRLYVELLEIWIEQLQNETAKAADSAGRADLAISRIATLDLNRQRQFAHVDEVESHGLFFLCSPSRHVRAFAIRVLRLVTKFDLALGRPSQRIIGILEGSSQQVINLNDEKLTPAERGRLQKGNLKSCVGSTMVEVCSSEIPNDSTLWGKVFPGLIRLSQATCPQAVLLTREIVCSRLLHTHAMISRLAEPSTDTNIAFKQNARQVLGSTDVTIEQWKLHVIFACSTLTDTGPSTPMSPNMGASSGTHLRRVAKSIGEAKIVSATDLFVRIVPFLGSSNERVRVAAAVGLGTISVNLYRALLDALHPSVISCIEDGKSRLGTHSRSLSGPRRARKTDNLRTEIMHLYRLTATCIVDCQPSDLDWIINELISFTKEIRILLNDDEIQNQLSFQKLRTYFCGLIEVLYESICKLDKGAQWLPQLSRKTVFSMMEKWCGYAPNQARINEREDSMRRTFLESASEGNQRGGMTVALEIERKDLRFAALNAMAALCAGPVSIISEGQVVMQFDIRRMLQWIDTIFNDTPSDKTHAAGRRALKNLITHNLDHSFLLARSLEMCYIARVPKTMSSYFEVVTQVLAEQKEHGLPFWKTLCAALFTLGNDKSEIRVKSARLLQSIEQGLGKSSKLQDLDISVSDKTTAVYKLAQFQISQRLSREHSWAAFHVFSEFSTYFKDLPHDDQRNMVSAMLPWLQTIELQVGPTGQPTASSHMLLVNMIEITIGSSHVLHNETQAVWQALATGPHGGNVQVVLDFIIAICLDKREQSFVQYAKQIVVFLSATPAGSKVIEFLLMQITPRSMVTEKAEAVPVPQNTSGLPYIADLDKILPAGAKQTGLSLGQLALMLLVDLVVSPVQLPVDKVPVLLHAVITQWDHYTTLVQDQAREMLVHLIHEVVISKMPSSASVEEKTSIDELIELIRKQDAKVMWTYEDSGSVAISEPNAGVIEQMVFVVQEVVRVFSTPVVVGSGSPALDVGTELARLALEWATTCPVRHIACRSFQTYRCILQKQDQQMLADMLARLSNTIADDDNDYLSFSREILMTLRTIIQRMQRHEILDYPQLFWITAACLDTIFEDEFDEALTMLEVLLDKVDLADPALLRIFNEQKPADWSGEFDGLHCLLYKGLRSSRSLERSLKLMERLLKYPSSILVGQPKRLLFTTLANIPRFLLCFDDRVKHADIAKSAELLSSVARFQGHDQLSNVLADFAAGLFEHESDFLQKILSAVQLAFFPTQEFDSLVFLIGLLNNQNSWFKIKTMKMLCVMLPSIDMRKPEFASQGPDLISPLLRLLQTSYCQQALDVLDNVMSMTGTPLDQKHIRMSMAGSHSSRATRKEYDSTKSLYGIPEESGWSIAMPAIHSARTRHNVQTVVRACHLPGLDLLDPAGTPKIEFHEDQAYNGYFPAGVSSGTSKDDRSTEGNMSEMVMKLDSLDDFFDDQEDENEHLQATHGVTRYSAMMNDERESLYDRHTLPILHKSLDRNASMTSFDASFGDGAAHASNSGFNLISQVAEMGFRPPMSKHARPLITGRSNTSPPAPGTRRNISNADSFEAVSYSEDDIDNENRETDDDRGASRPTTADESSSQYAFSPPASGLDPASWSRNPRPNLSRIKTETTPISKSGLHSHSTRQDYQWDRSSARRTGQNKQITPPTVSDMSSFEDGDVTPIARSSSGQKNLTSVIT